MCLFFKTEPQLNIPNRPWSVINSVLKISSTPCHQEAWKSITNSNPPQPLETQWHTPILNTNPETTMTACRHLKMDEHGNMVLLEVVFRVSGGVNVHSLFLYPVGGFVPIQSSSKTNFRVKMGSSSPKFFGVKMKTNYI